MRQYRKDDQMKLLNDELHNELLKEDLEKDVDLRNIAARKLRIKELEEKIKGEKLPGKAALAGERSPEDLTVEKAVKAANEAKVGRMVELLSKSKKADAIGRLIRHAHEERGSAKRVLEKVEEAAARFKHKGRYASVLPGIKTGRTYSTVAKYRSSIPEAIPCTNEIVHVPRRSRASTGETSVDSENRLFTHGGARTGSGRPKGSKNKPKRKIQM